MTEMAEDRINMVTDLFEGNDPNAVYGKNEFLGIRWVVNETVIMLGMDKPLFWSLQGAIVLYLRFIRFLIRNRK